MFISSVKFWLSGFAISSKKTSFGIFLLLVSPQFILCAANFLLLKTETTTNIDDVTGSKDPCCALWARPLLNRATECHVRPYQEFIYPLEFDLVTWHRMVKFIELNVSKFCLLNFIYVSYHWDILKTSNRQNLNLTNFIKCKMWILMEVFYLLSIYMYMYLTHDIDLQP